MVAQRSILNRTLRRLRQAWSELNTTLRGNDRYQFDPSLNERDVEHLRQLIKGCLSAPGGEFAMRAQAAHIGHAYMTLNQQGRVRFLRLLATDFDADNQAIQQAIKAYNQAGSADNLPKLRHKLSKALVAPRVQLLTLFNALPEGIKFLVDMRGELLDMGAHKDVELGEVERDLKHLLSSWFDIGFLQLQQLTWNSPASLLEKLIEYEAVHEIASWADLKNRLAPDRRLFAFLHPNMEDEPLIFVQVALCNGLASNVQALLDTHARIFDVEHANTAIFYSISNAQRGLSGISFGNFLIKRVVANLKRELPQIEQFATLSPVPGFMVWLASQMLDGDTPLLSVTERHSISVVASELSIEKNLGGLLGLSAWHQNTQVTQVLQPILLRLCAEYLLGLEPGKLRARDGVAHFHLSNGATLQQMNWMADISAKGIRQSCGMMVNYLYDPLTIDTNSEDYVQTGSIAVSAEVRELRKDKVLKHVKSAG
ncbi:MAG TPA: malonyl-CoA decarboxylase [Pseudomonadales bacterium]|nr:malonyl-CoA decarboxylase [Pseudomonadales bacterium]